MAKGDQAAFEALYDQLAASAYGLVRKVLRDPSQAEEVTQEVLLEVWRTASRFDPDARIVSGPTTAGGVATVVASRRAGKIVFTSAGLRVLPSTQVYELWFLGSSGARPAGLVSPASSGATTPVLASGLTVGDRVGVTVEPAGGTKTPTTTRSWC